MQTDIRPNNSPVVTRREFLTRMVLREEWVDEDEDGKFDYRIEFDPFGKPTEHLPIPAVYWLPLQNSSQETQRIG